MTREQASSSASVYASAAASASAAAAAAPGNKPGGRGAVAASNADHSPCTLFALRQYECVARDKLECWPLDRIFRQCAGGPAYDVTNRLVHAGHPGGDGEPAEPPLVDPAFIAHPPRGKHWNDLRED